MQKKLNHTYIGLCAYYANELQSRIPWDIIERCINKRLCGRFPRSKVKDGLYVFFRSKKTRYRQYLSEFVLKGNLGSFVKSFDFFASASDKNQIFARDSSKQVKKTCFIYVRFIASRVVDRYYVICKTYESRMILYSLSLFSVRGKAVWKWEFTICG